MPVNPATLADLRRETPADEVKQRPMFKNKRATGKTLSYIDARYVMDTLDEVVGPENWRDEYKVLPGGAVECTIYVFVTHQVPVGAEGTVESVAGWVGKSDVGVPSSIEPQKGAYSDAFKRAAVKHGIARDLYEEREDEGERDARPIRERTNDDDLPFEEDRPATSSRSGTRASSRPAQRSSGSTRPRQNDQAARLVEAQDEYDRFMEGWDPEQSPWFCPDHDAVKIKEPGIGAKSGKAYGGFLICTERGCDEKGPWVSDLLKEQEG